MGQLAAKAYDRFRVELSNVVVVLAEVRRVLIGRMNNVLLKTDCFAPTIVTW